MKQKLKPLTFPKMKYARTLTLLRDRQHTHSSGFYFHLFLLPSKDEYH